MVTGQNITEYTDYVKLMLGADVLGCFSKEISDPMLEQIVNLAFQEIKNYISDTETLTVPFQNQIDLTGRRIFNIIYVMRSKSSIGPGGFQDIMWIYSRNSALGSYTLTDYARSLMIQQNKQAISTDLDFKWERRNEQLYLHCNNAQPRYVTLVYTLDYQSVEEIIEPFWINLIKRLSLAYAKERLGRIRGKYKLNSSLYQLDADTLLSESRTELSEIRAYLNDNTDLLLPLD